MEEKQILQYRQHFNLSESAKQMLDGLTAQRYPGKQRRQSQLVEDLIVEAFSRAQTLPAAPVSPVEEDKAGPMPGVIRGRARVYQSTRTVRTVAEEGALYAQPDSHPCSFCQREMRTGWKHCVYCGAGLTLSCSCCGLPAAEVEGAEFCYDCGCPLL